MAMKEYSPLPRTQELEPHNQIISRTTFAFFVEVGSLLSWREYSQYILSSIDRLRKFDAQSFFY